MSQFNQAFSATVSLKFKYKKKQDSNTKTYDIDRSRIQFIMLKYQYENVQVLPVVYLSLKVPLDLHDMILNTYQTSTFHLKIQRKNGLSNSATASTTVDDTFDYVTDNTNINQSPVLSNNGTDINSYIPLTIGLVSRSMSEKLRQTYDGNIMETNSKNLIGNVTKGLGKVISSPIKYNKSYDELQVTTQNTKYKMLKYLFDENAYYDANFTFFMDFKDKTYLIEKDGKKVDTGGKPAKCIIHVTDVTNANSFATGNTIKNNAYNIYVNAANVDVHVEEGSDRNVNKLVAYGYDTGDQSLYIAGSGSGNKDKALYTRTNNIAAEQNEITNGRVVVELFKSAIDSTILTPNKQYEIKHQNNYKKYNGTYILSYKTESYTPMSNEAFTITTSAGFKLIEKVTKANAVKNSHIDNRYNNYNTDSSADQKTNTGNVTKANRSR